MAATSDFTAAGMADRWLSPRLLRLLIRDHLPAFSGPLPAPSELSAVVRAVKNHGLLAENVNLSSDPQFGEVWRSAVDSWVDGVLKLVSSDMTDKRWAGVCLLGVTCEECSSDRFVTSYSFWFQNLLSTIQTSSSSFVKVASCASLSDMFTRLSGFPNLKKDAISFAGKVIRPILEFLDEDESEAVKDAAADMLLTVMMLFPSSLTRHYDNVESILISNILSSNCSSDILKKFAHCLALLPKVRGDEDSWSLLMQKILMGIDDLLCDAFQGLEDVSRSSNFKKLLNPPGNEPPPAFAVRSWLLESSKVPTKRLGQLVVPTISTLIQCCCIMLNNTYSVQVTIPVRTLVALVERVLGVSGSLPDSRKPSTTALHQDLLCNELPVLHLDSLDLLIAVVKGVRSQLLPHAANVARILTGYFRKATFHSIRIKLYFLARTLLISTGVGMALYLSEEVINNAVSDLKCCVESSPSLLNKCTSGVAARTLVPCSPRKRKFASVTTSQHSNDLDYNSEQLITKPSTPLSLKIAALKALEALLTVGGSLRSDCWRPNVDGLLITVATNACEEAWSYDGTMKEKSSSSLQDFQLAALQALLASLLSPSHVRPPHLSEGLELFRRGKLETGTELAAFCAHALLALEVLIHPRALPINDFTGSKSSAFDEEFQGYCNPSANMSSFGAFGNMNDDERYCDWFNTPGDEQPANTSEDALVAGKDEVNPVVAHVTSDATRELEKSVEMNCVSGEVSDKFNNTKEPEKIDMSTRTVTSNELAGNDKLVETPKTSGVANMEIAYEVSGVANGNDASESRGFSDKGKDAILNHDSDSDSVELVLGDSDIDIDTD